MNDKPKIEKRIDVRAEELFGKPWPKRDMWGTFSMEERETAWAAWYAARWEVVEKPIIDKFTAMTGASTVEATSYFLALRIDKALSFIEGLQRHEPPKEPWEG